METKPVFCSECGAKLTGSAIFCSKCGAKQQAAPSPVAEVVPAPVAEPVPEVVPAPVVEPVPEVVPVTAPDPVPEVVPVTVPDPVPEVKPAPAPVSAPANALPRKAKLSVFGLIVAVLALGAALLANVLFVVNLVMMYGDHFSDIGLNLLMNSATGMITAMIVPLAALIVVFTKKKPLAVVGLILAVLSLVMQFVFSIVYVIAVRQGLSFSVLGVLLRPVNGEALFMDIQQIFHAAGRSSKVLVRLLVSLSASLLYFGKNILAAITCLAVVVKRKK